MKTDKEVREMLEFTFPEGMADVASATTLYKRSTPYRRYGRYFKEPKEGTSYLDSNNILLKGKLKGKHLSELTRNQLAGLNGFQKMDKPSRAIIQQFLKKAPKRNKKKKG